MNKLLTALSIVASIAVSAIHAPDQAVAGGLGNNYIAPSVTFGDGVGVFGIDSKIGIADNISLRPFIAFPSGGTNFGTSITYDWDLRQSATEITPFVGVGLNIATANNNNSSQTTGFAQIGADFNVNEQFSLVGSVSIPFDNKKSATSVTLGAGFRF